MEVEIYKMIYDIENNIDDIRILGNTFIKNNKNKGKLIINNKKQSIKEFISINFIKANKFKIKILLIKNILNKSYFFKDCKSLLEISISNKEKNLSGNIIKFKDEEENENFIDVYPEENKSNIYEDIVNYPYLNISEISQLENKSDINSINSFIYDLDFNTNIYNGYFDIYGNKYNEKHLNSYSSRSIYFNWKGMFYNCSSLNSVSNFFKFNKENY